jgi:hypothetical protein
MVLLIGRRRIISASAENRGNSCQRKHPDPGTRSELRFRKAAAQTRAVSMAGIRLGSGESARAFKGIICDDISEFESHMPSHAVWSL